MAIELRLLRSALALAEHRSFVRAANDVHISQPSLSRNIQALERIVGTKLFERAPDGVVSTDAGKIFLEQAGEVIARSADLQREMDLIRGIEKGELNIGAGTYTSVMVVDGAIIQLVRAHPSVRLQIHNDHRDKLLPLLHKRELDLAVVLLDASQNDSELEITRLHQHQGYFVVRRGHPLLRSKEMATIQSILQFPLASASRIPIAMLKQLLAGVKTKSANQSLAKSFPTIACESLAMMKRISGETDAVSILPLNVVWPEIQRGQLAILPLVPPAIKVAFAIIRLAHRSLSPLGDKFVSLVQEADEELLRFEQKNGPKFLAPRQGTRSKAMAATGAG
jgi:DNA-binding transcriptional LysR family regulator